MTTLLLIGVNFVLSVVGNLLSDAIKKRLTQAKPTPETMPGPNRFMGLLRSPWILPPSFIAADVLWLVYDFRSHDHTFAITRLEVYNIAAMATAIWYNLSWMSMSLMRQALRHQGETMVASFQQISEGLKGTTKALAEWKEKNDLATQAALEQALATFRKTGEILSAVKEKNEKAQKRWKR
ncbi:MAG TPA: hypothetical protein VLV88_10355 [Terriglobales bacterium]|nr:hypothetical protein [Terriglobales bacterium]